MSKEHGYIHDSGVEPSLDTGFPSRLLDGPAPRASRPGRSRRAVTPQQLSLAWRDLTPTAERLHRASVDPLDLADAPEPAAEATFPGPPLTPREWAVLAESVEEYLRVFTEANSRWWADDDDRPGLLRALLEKLPVVS
jgi:hypothetical protein